MDEYQKQIVLDHEYYPTGRKHVGIQYVGNQIKWLDVGVGGENQRRCATEAKKQNRRLCRRKLKRVDRDILKEYE